MVEEPCLDSRKLLLEVEDSFNKISGPLSCVKDALSALQRKQEYYELLFDSRGKFEGMRSKLSSEPLITPDDYRAVEIAGDCEHLSKWVEELWAAYGRADEALIALPEEVAQLLSDHVGKPWRPMVRQECLDILLVWPGEVIHTRAAKKICTRVPDLLKLAAEHPPYEKWKYFLERLGEYRSHILAVYGDVTPIRTKTKSTVNDRMKTEMVANLETVKGWTAQRWASHLECAKSTVVGTKTWGSLNLLRKQAKVEKRNDRRRKPKASDQKKF